MLSTVIEKQSATRKTALTRAPRTSALAQPKVFLDQDLGAILTLRNAMTRAAMSDNMWKLSATRAIEFVTYPGINKSRKLIKNQPENLPTTISTKKKATVRLNMLTRRHFLPVYRDPPLPSPVPILNQTLMVG